MLQFLQIEDFCNPRPDETKLGETMYWLDKNWKHQLEGSSWQHVIVGVDEDFGPRANYGQPGAKGFFQATLKKLCNQQENLFASGKNTAILGVLSPENLAETTDKAVLSNQVKNLDQTLSEILLPLFKAGKTPIILGGGHNNALPLLRASSIAYNTPMQVVNVDAHADFRNTDLRHSGNSFSTAYLKGYLGYYLMVGLHKNYNNQSMLESLATCRGAHLFLEDWLKLGGQTEYLAQWLTTQLHSKLPLGLEIDLDALAGLAASAQTFFGFSVDTVRQLISYIANNCNPRYVNITEGVADEAGFTPKTAALLLITFITNHHLHGYS